LAALISLITLLAIVQEALLCVKRSEAEGQIHGRRIIEVL
jgi:hypothetical protein